MKPSLPKLHEVQGGRPAGGKRKIVVFVHGIFSSHETFNYLLATFTSDARFDGYDLATFDYDWGQPIQESARQLRDRLNGPRIPRDAEVTLVGHSMGGLVCRFALMGGDVPCVRRIFMLGTPNRGALTASQVNLAWQIVIAGTGKLLPFYPRKAGLRDLTRVQTLYDEAKASRAIVPSRARNVMYVTIPGLFYGRDRRDTDPGHDGSAILFTIGTLLVRVLANVPFSGIEIERPHDGVVEESSVSMITGKADDRSEKATEIGAPKGKTITYCHVVPDSARMDTHMGIQMDSNVADIVKDLTLADSIVAWHSTMTLDQQDDIKVVRPMAD